MRARVNDAPPNLEPHVLTPALGQRGSLLSRPAGSPWVALLVTLPDALT